MVKNGEKKEVKKSSKKKKEKKKGLVLPSWVREHFVPISVGIIILLFSLIFVRGLVQRVIRLSGENKRLKGDLSSLVSKADALEETDLAELNSQVGMMEEVFSSKKPSLALLATLSSLSREQNVLFSGIELSPGKIEEIKKEEGEIKRARLGEKGKLKDFTVGFSVEGKLSDVSQFVARLEKIAPVMKIESFGLRFGQSKNTGTATGQVKVNLTVRVFYQEPPEAIGPVEQKLPVFTSEEKALLVELAVFETEAAVLPQVPAGQDDLFGTGQ